MIGNQGGEWWEAVHDASRLEAKIPGISPGSEAGRRVSPRTHTRKLGVEACSEGLNSLS